MPLYNVHVYRELKLRFDGIEAESIEEAAIKGADMRTKFADEIEDCEGENISALVDVVGDDEYEQSRFIDFEGERQRKSAHALLQALKNIAATARTFRNVPYEQQGWTATDDAALDEAFAAIAQAEGEAA